MKMSQCRPGVTVRVLYECPDYAMLPTQSAKAEHLQLCHIHSLLKVRHAMPRCGKVLVEGIEGRGFNSVVLVNPASLVHAPGR